MITIEYDPINGMVMPDGEWFSFMVEYIKNPTNLIIGNESAIYLIRLLIKHGYINHTDIIFKYKDTLIKCFENGKLEYYPEGMCDNSLVIMGCLARNSKSNDIIKMFKDRYGNYNQNR
jgi:hypothetical protein